jgi:phage I-like protein
MLTKPASFTAMLAALDLPQAADVPGWVHLLPVLQGNLPTFDGRGPYRMTDPQAVIAASFAADPRNEHGLVIDENHALELGAPKGMPSPSRGRIVAMEARADGIWGRVEWNAAGRALLADQSYRGISPVIIHDATGRVLRIKNAALTNYANLRDLTALNQETPMTLMEQLIAKLGLPATATEADILAAVDAPDAAACAEAAQAQMAEIATIIGLPGGEGTAVVAAVKARTTALPAEVTALQAELAQVTTDLKAMKRDRSVAFVEDAIKAGRVGVKPSRDRFITMHMSDPAGTEAIIAGLPTLAASHTTDLPPRTPEDATSLNAEELAVAKVLGRTPTEFAAMMAADRKAKEARL